MTKKPNRTKTEQDSKQDRKFMRLFLRGIKLQSYYMGSCDDTWQKVKTAKQLLEALQCKNTLVREKPETEYWQICTTCARAFPAHYEFLNRDNEHLPRDGTKKRCANKYAFLKVKVVGDSSMTDTWTSPSFSDDE